MAGRKPIPTNLKLLKGTAQPCRIKKDEPKPKADDIRMPESLSDNAKKHWEIVCKQLQDADIITNLDAHALAMYCEAYSRWTMANEQIAKYGVIIKTPNGFPAQSPYLQIANKAFDQMKLMLVEFGMTPSSRSRIGTVTKSENDPLEDYMNRK